MNTISKCILTLSLLCATAYAEDEKCFVWGEDTEAGASAHTECSLVYAKDTDKLFRSDGTTLTEIAAAGGGGSDSFVTIAPSTGSSPVADSTTDTLTMTCTAPLVCTGDSATDTVTFSLTGLILDLGDDGGNDSTALAEISTVNDDYSVVTESSTNEMQIDFGKVAPYRQYDPNRPPSSCDTCDEFTGNTETLSWAWANQDSATSSVVHTGVEVVGEATGDEIRGRCVDAPSAGNVDFSAHVRMFGLQVTTEQSCGITFLTGGTLGAPTETRTVRVHGNASAYMTGDSDFDYGAGATNTHVLDLGFATPHVNFNYGMYIRLDYNNTAATVSGYVSSAGALYQTVGTAVAVTGDPSKVCVVAEDAATCRFEFIRIRTDADRLDVGE